MSGAEDFWSGLGPSVGGFRWRERPVDARLAAALAQRHQLPELVARALAARRVGLDEVERFLKPQLRTALPDPSALKDMDRAAGRLARAVQAGERIAVFGDYDVDGATSAALLVRHLRALGVEALTYIPDRIAEGYGPNAAALLGLRRAGVELVVTVDCGTVAFEPLAAAAEAGLDVIVLDHHAAEARLPPAVAVVNPNRLDEQGSLGQLAACGVTFLLLIALNRALRTAGFFRSRREPDLLGLLDLVAVGTICDVVPLTGLNRALVCQGLKVLAGRRNPGLRALADLARIGERLDAYHIGFHLGPRLNAGGRVGRADLGLKLLTTDDPIEAAEMAAVLDGNNDDRRTIEAAVLREATARLEAMTEPGPVPVAAGAGWHPGVIGIVAGRLKERYARPVCVVALEGGLGKGSGRSVPGVDLGAAVIEARRAGLLLAGGGHAMAAGFTVEEGRLDDLRAFLAAHVRAQAAGSVEPVLEFDGALAVGAATPDTARLLDSLGPFGSGNAQPRFLLRAARVRRAEVVKGSHVRCTLAGADGGSLRAIAFRVLDTPLGQALLAARDVPLHLAGTMRVETWQGAERVSFHIEDAAPVWQS